GAWSVAFVVLAAKSRGGMLAVVAAILLVLAFRRTKQSPRLLLGAGLALGAFALLFTVVGNVQIFDRTISLSQVVENAVSIFDSSRNSGLAGTVQWRLDWWGKVINYTIFGDNFWTGKGFGINLADSDGFQTNGSLRSPHNAHITILARSGVPGLVLWVMVLVTFYASMTKAYLSARRLGQRHFANASLWILAYTTALLVNMSFDVYLEGPQGGIWFWSVMGFGIALSERQRREARIATQTIAENSGHVSYV
ncbi:MAG: O-antigen ligase family protein, partial [Proteobacteria bacterium]|nr:O-antigen ligase family protein [Pseudomonadota bacterium]